MKDKEFAGQKRFVPYIIRGISLSRLRYRWGLILYLNGEAVRELFHRFHAGPKADGVRHIPAQDSLHRLFAIYRPDDSAVLRQAIFADPGPRRDVLHLPDDRTWLDELVPLRRLADRRADRLFFLQLHAQQIAPAGGGGEGLRGLQFFTNRASHCPLVYV